jgi:hypothetical protein
MSEIVSGQIVGIDPSGITVHIPYSNWERFAVRQVSEVRVELPDARARSAEQLRKAWAIMGDMAAFISGDKRNAADDVYRPLSADFAQRAQETLQRRLFHLSEASVTEARDFSSFLLDTCIEYEIPLSRPAAELTDDIQHYVYSCTVNRKCAVCGQRADLHHVDHVGMGRNRHEIDHEGMRALPLCRVHHTEYHTIGGTAFGEKYHIVPVALDKRLAQKYNITGRAAS